MDRMDKKEVIRWLKIMKANLNIFPEVSCEKKIKALAEAIRLLIFEQSENPTGSTTKNDLGVDCISRQDVLSEIIRFSTEEGSSVECQQLYCDINNMPSVTPIKPKGHGRLIDADEVLVKLWNKNYDDPNDAIEFAKIINEAPTVIEADKGE